MRRKIEVTMFDGSEGKVCGTCDNWKPLTDYHKSKSNKGGRAYSCKSCATNYRKEYNKVNKERFRTRYLENIEKVRAYRKERYWQERDTVLKTRKEMSEEERYRINRNRRLAYPKHREKYVSNARKRRTALHGLDFNFNQLDKKEISSYFKGCCLSGSTDFHWDHVIPISTGHSGTTKENMIPLRGDLNKSKKDLNIFEWFEANRQRFNLPQEKFDNLISWLASANGVTTEDYRDYVYWCHENPQHIDDLKEGETLE